jgi:hypothetical protein
VLRGWAAFGGPKEASRQVVAGVLPSDPESDVDPDVDVDPEPPVESLELVLEVLVESVEPDDVPESLEPASPLDDDDAVRVDRLSFL